MPQSDRGINADLLEPTKRQLWPPSDASVSELGARMPRSGRSIEQDARRRGSDHAEHVSDAQHVWSAKLQRARRARVLTGHARRAAWSAGGARLVRTSLRSALVDTPAAHAASAQRPTGALGTRDSTHYQALATPSDAAEGGLERGVPVRERSIDSRPVGADSDQPQLPSDAAEGGLERGCREAAGASTPDLLELVSTSSNRS